MVPSPSVHAVSAAAASAAPAVHAAGPVHAALPEQMRIVDALAGAQVFFPIALCIIGALLMIFGFKAYRWIVFLNFVALGYWLGELLGQKSEIGMVGGVVGGVLMGIVAIPLMKYAVAVCGGLVGAVIGMVVWAYCQQPLDMAWAGGLVGLAVLGMLSFILFKTTVILFTSVEGAAMFVLGASALLMRYPPWSQEVGNSLVDKPVLMPLLVTSIAILALFWQHQKHGLIGHEGAPGGSHKPSGSSGEAKKNEPMIPALPQRSPRPVLCGRGGDQTNLSSHTTAALLPRVPPFFCATQTRRLDL